MIELLTIAGRGIWISMEDKPTEEEALLQEYEGDLAYIALMKEIQERRDNGEFEAFE